MLSSLLNRRSLLKVLKVFLPLVLLFLVATFLTGNHLRTDAIRKVTGGHIFGGNSYRSRIQLKLEQIESKMRQINEELYHLEHDDSEREHEQLIQNILGPGDIGNTNNGGEVDPVAEKTIENNPVVKKPEVTKKPIVTTQKTIQKTAQKTTTKTVQTTTTPKKAPLKPTTTTKAKPSDKKSQSEPVSKTTHPSNVTQSSNVTRYIVYFCQGPCYGWGDRQRAIVSLYYLAVVTHRELVINMTSPSLFTDFYEPSKLNWLPPKDNFKGKTSVKLKAFGGEFLFAWDKDDFNAKYPQEVVYITTNQNFYIPLQKNPLYHKLLPRMTRWDVHSHAWLNLLQPTHELRSSLNNQLVKIAVAQRKEQSYHKTTRSKQCNSTCLICANTTSWKSLDNQSCEYSQSINTSTNNNTSYFKPCSFPNPEVTTTIQDDAIRKAKGHDAIDINLVCVHIRIGYSQTMIGEPIRNKWEHLPVVWKFLEPYIQKGHHIYLATDSQRVRDLAQAALGPRVHMSSVQITHTDQAHHAKDVAREGFKLTLTETLLLSTSCKVLVISKSNFSVRSGMLRRALMGQVDLFSFRDGGVFKTDAWYLF